MSREPRRSQDSMSLSGRSYGSERKKANSAGPSASKRLSPSSAASSRSVRVTVPASASTLQRHEALLRAVQGLRRRRLLMGVFSTWITSCKVNRYLQGKIEILYEEYFYKWLNTRRRERCVRRNRRAQNHHVRSAYSRVFSVLLSQRARGRKDRETHRRNSRLISYYKNSLKKKMFRCWKASIRSRKINNTLQMEHQERRSKIQNFVKTLQKPVQRVGKESIGSCISQLVLTRQGREQEGQGQKWREGKEEAEYCPRSRPPPSPTAEPAQLHKHSECHNEKILKGRGSRDIARTVERKENDNWDDGENDEYYCECEYDDDEGAPPSFASLTLSAPPSPRSSITTSPLRSPRHPLLQQQHGDITSRGHLASRAFHAGNRVSVSGRRPNDHSHRDDASAHTISNNSKHNNNFVNDNNGGRSTITPSSGRSDDCDSSSQPRRPHLRQEQQRQRQKGQEETLKERRERLRALQQETAERILKKKANDEEMKRRKEDEEERQLAQQRFEHRNKLAALKTSKSTRLCAGVGEGGGEAAVARRAREAKASSFRARQLLIRWGISPWVLLVRERRLDWLKACTFHSDGLVQAVWAAWAGRFRAFRRAMWLQERRHTGMAVSLRRLLLLRRVWRGFSRRRQALAAKARAVHSHCVQYGGRKRALAAWRVSLEKRRREVTQCLARHSRRSRRSVLTACWQRWKDFLQEVAVEKEIDSRVDMTWMRVQQWLT